MYVCVRKYAAAYPRYYYLLCVLVLLKSMVRTRLVLSSHYKVAIVWCDRIEQRGANCEHFTIRYQKGQ